MTSCSSSEAPIIRCVAFDAVGTLIEAEPSVADVYTDIGRRHGSRLNREHVLQRFVVAFELCAESDRKKGAAGLLTSEEREWARWRWIVGEIFSEIDDVNVVGRIFEELFTHFGQPESWRCFRDVGAAVATIEEFGLPMVIASNFDHRLHGICQGLIAVQRARAVLVSSEVGWKKPAPEFYSALIAECGCRPDEVLMVGDDRVNDFEGARASGLQAVLLDRSAENVDGNAASSSIRPTVIGSLSDLGFWYSQD